MLQAVNRESCVRQIGRCRKRAFAIADARSVLKAVKKHWARLKSRGATDAQVKQYEELIAAAQRAEAAVAGNAPDKTLEDVRHALKNLLGDFRATAAIIARGFDGPEPGAAVDLKADVAFPRTDRDLRNFVRGLDKQVGVYSVQLAERGFGKQQQAQLAGSEKQFVAALEARGQKRGERKSVLVARAAVFEQLAHKTQYFRLVADAALRTSKERADFDRVQPHKAKKASKEPAPKVIDQYGVHWQIVPAEFNRWNTSKNKKKTEAVMHAMWQMVKLDRERLKAAFDRA